MPTTSLAHARNRQKAVEDMVVTLWTNLAGLRRDPLVPHRLSEWPQVTRNTLGLATGHYLDRDVSQEAWTEVVERIHRLIEAETGVEFAYVGERDCPTCDGEGSVHGSRIVRRSLGGPVTEEWEADCPDCDDGRIPCLNCEAPDSPAVLVVSDVECCAGCRHEACYRGRVGGCRPDRSLTTAQRDAVDGWFVMVELVDAMEGTPAEAPAA